MSNYISQLDDNVRFYGEFLESIAREAREVGMPQYKLFIYPLYKCCAKRIGDIAATAVTFAASDALIHQLGSKAFGCLVKSALNSDQVCDLSINWKITLAWSSIALPIMYAKYRRRQEYQLL